jgi:DNA-binding CsgD family transcriptional regulator
MNEPLSEIAMRRSSPMIIMFDYNGKVIHVSNDVTELFKNKLPDEILAFFHDLKDFSEENSKKKSDQIEVQTKQHLTIQEDNYLCRGICLYEGKKINKAKFLMILDKLTARNKNDYELAKKIYRLTPREMDIINLLFNGYTNKEIANALHISEPTVKGHLQIIMAKMRVTTRTGILSKVVEL